MSETPMALANLPAWMFPLTIQLLAATTGEVIHTIHVAGPGPVEIPGLRAKHGPILVRIIGSDGLQVY